MRNEAPHIAIVDDDLSVRKGLRRLLESAGFAVSLYASGEAFLHSLRNRACDCLLLDLEMPGLSGGEVLQELRRSGRRIATVVLSAYDGAEIRERCLEAGVAAFFHKPVEGKALLAAIDRALDGHTRAEIQAAPTSRAMGE